MTPNNVVRKDAITQLVFILTTGVLFILLLASEIVSLPTYLLHGYSLLYLGSVSLYTGYLAISGFSTKRFPVDNARLIFDMPQYVGWRARVLSVVLLFATLSLVGLLIFNMKEQYRLDQIEGELLEELKK